MDNRAVGLGFVAAAAVAVVSITRPSAPRPEPVDSASVAQAGAKEAGGADSPFEGGKDLLAGFFGAAPAASDTFSLDVLIACIPDPYDSHLDWSFDGAMETLRRAFETAGYVTDRFWLPGQRDSVRQADHRRVALREVRPGVVLFRSSKSDERRLHLLYLVHELPTRGIYKEALTAALEERLLLLNPGKLPLRPERAGPIRIIGPNFSGSALSLSLTLRSWLADHAKDSVYILSGTATSPDNVATLDNPPGVTFKAAINTDQKLNQTLESVIHRLGLHRSEVALLRESSTQYGQALLAPAPTMRDTADTNDRTQFVIVPFPMSISSLRAEYQRVPAAEAAEPALSGPSEAPRLPLDLLDPARPKEDFPVTSRLSPLALDLMLDDLARTLNRRRIRMVGLLATDVRDKLFLGEELRKRMPDVQFFTYESNVLYLRSDKNLALRGMLVFSTYPLILDNQELTADKRQNQRYAFSSDGVQGLYNATLIHLGYTQALLDYRPIRKLRTLKFDTTRTKDIDPKALNADPLKIDTLETNQRGLRPPVWVSTVGNRTFLPIDAQLQYGSRYLARGCQADSLCPAVPRNYPPVHLTFLPLAAILFTCFSLFVISIENMKLDQQFRSAAKGASSEYDLRPIPDQLMEGSLRLHDRFYGLLRVVAIVGIALAADAPVLRLLYPQTGTGRSPSPDPLFPVLGLLVAVVGSIGVAALVSGMVAVASLAAPLVRPGLKYFWSGPWRIPSDPWAWRVEVLARLATATFGIVYLSLSIGFVTDVLALSSPDPQRFWLFFRRALEIDSMVSPVLPLVIGGLGYAVWCTWHLRRITLLKQRTIFESVCEAELSSPPPSRTTFRSALRDDLRRSAVDIRIIRLRLFRIVPTNWALGLLVAFVCLGFWLGPQFGRSLEAITTSSPDGVPMFDKLFRVTVLAMLFATSWGALRLAAVWIGLRRCLEGFARMPIVTAFDRLPPRLARLTRLSLPGRASGTAIGAVADLQWLHLQGIHEARREDFAAELGPDQEELAHAVAELMKAPAAEALWLDRVGRRALMERFGTLHDVLRELWRLEPMKKDVDALIEGLNKEFERPSPRAGEEASTALLIRRGFSGPVRLWLRAAEEYTGTRMVEYVEWVTRHLRELALFMLLSLLLATLLLSSYPYPPQSLLRLILLVVLGGTVGTLIVVLVQMNRDEVLSRIDRTEPGRVTWNFSFVMNLLTFGALPLLTLLSSEFPELRKILFAWADPILKMLAKQ
jgi:hypothetical protein